MCCHILYMKSTHKHIMMQKCGHLEPFEPPATNPFCLSVAQKEYFIIIYKSFSSVLPGASCNLYGLCVCVCVCILFSEVPKEFSFFQNLEENVFSCQHYWCVCLCAHDLPVCSCLRQWLLIDIDRGQ